MQPPSEATTPCQDLSEKDYLHLLNKASLLKEHGLDQFSVPMAVIETSWLGREEMGGGVVPIMYSVWLHVPYRTENPSKTVSRSTSLLSTAIACVRIACILVNQGGRQFLSRVLHTQWPVGPDLYYNPSFAEKIKYC